MAAAHRWEGQRIYCTTNTLAYKKNTVESGLYCLLGRHRLISSTATVLSWPTASLQSTDHCAVARHPTRTDWCLVIWDTTAVVATMPTLWNAGVHAYTHANLQQWWPAACCMALADSYCCCCLYLYAAHSKTSHSARASCGFSVKITLSWPLRRALQIRSRSIDCYGRP